MVDLELEKLFCWTQAYVSRKIGVPHPMGSALSKHVIRRLQGTDIFLVGELQHDKGVCYVPVRNDGDGFVG